MAKFYDTLLGEYIKNPGQRGLSLDNLAESYFSYHMISYDEITGKGKIPFQDVHLSDAAIYSGEDVLVTQWIFEKQQENEYLKKSTVLHEIEIPLMLVLSKMEQHGVKIERDIPKGLGIQIDAKVSELEKEIYELAGEEFNIQSPKQVGEILYEKLGYSPEKKTKTGYSVSAEVLENLAKKAPIASKIVEFRHYSKLKSTYIEGLQNVADENDRVHTSYNQAVAATGRLSSTNPNLQNIPSGEAFAGEIRSAFIPDDENSVMMACDYSQIEVRLLAIMSKDENLLGAFKQGRDIHQVTAEFIFGKKEITPNQRKFAKAVNFGVIYGISPFGLSNMIDISQKEAKSYIEAFYANYPKVREFYDKTLEKCRETGFVETLFGRRRYISGINDRNRMMQQAAEREAINMPIQGSNADIIKIAMIQISDFLEAGKYTTKMLMQVHDELVFSVPKNELKIMQEKIPEIMESILPNSEIPLKVDCNFGKNWKQAK